MRRDSPPARSARALLGALTLAGLAAIVVHPGFAVASSSSARPAAAPAGDRKEATATLLADGTVLASGGTGQAQPAEVYDPAKGSWTATGPMMQPRVGHAATGLDDGRVLVTGGVVDAVATATAEIYDPAARTWAATAPMAAARSFHTATLLRDGRVLVAGGQAAGHGPFVSEAEVFDPAAGSWSSAGALEQGRSFPAAARLADGRVLVTGGQGDPHGTSLRDASVYDPPSNTWSVVPELMAVGRSNHTMTVLGNGMVLIAGGTPQRQGDNDGDQIQASAELFDPTSWSFVPAAPMATARASQAAVALADGRALVVGGQSARGGVLIPATTAEVYDPSADRWEPAGTVARAADSWRTTAVLMKDDVLVLDGGAQLLSVPVSGSNSADIAGGAAGSSNARAAVIAVGLAVAVFIGVLSAFRYGAGRRQAGGW